jgi:hypothetical protein
MSAKPTTQLPPTTQPANKPAGPVPAPAQTKPGPVPPAQQKPTPAAPTKAAPAAPVLPDATQVKTSIRTKFPNDFQTDADFTATKIDTVTAQGLRFRMDRNRGELVTQFLPILKFGGLLKPGLLYAKFKIGAKQIDIFNIFTGKMFLTLRHTGKGWEIVHVENNNTVQGVIQVTQDKEVKVITVLVNNNKTSECRFKCPPQKTGCCAAPRPAQLLSINFVAQTKGADFEENPNGDVCKDNLEVNAYYRAAHDAAEFALIVAMFQIAAVELS